MLLACLDDNDDDDEAEMMLISDIESWIFMIGRIKLLEESAILYLPAINISQYSHIRVKYAYKEF